MRLFDLLIHVAEERDFAVSDIHIDCGVPPALRLPDGLRSVRGYETGVKSSDIEDLLRDLGLDAQDILARVAAGGGQTRLSACSAWHCAACGPPPPALPSWACPRSSVSSPC
jgi:hypothetical protein